LEGIICVQELRWEAWMMGLMMQLPLGSSARIQALRLPFPKRSLEVRPKQNATPLFHLTLDWASDCLLVLFEFYCVQALFDKTSFIHSGYS
jgi:hypothetical protein